MTGQSIAHYKVTAKLGQGGSLLDQFINAPRSGYASRVVKGPPQQAIALAVRAMLCAPLNRPDEARTDLEHSLAQLKLALGDKPGHDRGENWMLVDQAEIHLRERRRCSKPKAYPCPRRTRSEPRSTCMMIFQ